MPYRLSSAAANDIVSILVYGIETFGPTQAEKYRDGLQSTPALIAETPHMGRRYGGAVRRFLFGRHVIFYEVRDDHVYVLRIRHAAVDTERGL